MKALSIIKYLFTLVGMGMLLGTFFIYDNTRSFLSSAVKAEGTVIELVRSRSSDSTTYRPVVHFSLNGQQLEFTSSSGSNPPGYSRGEKVEVLYTPTNPQDARINSFFSVWGSAVILGGLGAVFFLIGTGILLAGILKDRKDKYLKKYGRRIETNYQSVELNTSYTVNGRNPFRVLTHWQNPVTSEIHIFKSNNLWFDPSDYINKKTITVFIENNNPKKYYVDLSFLPRLAE